MKSITLLSVILLVLSCSKGDSGDPSPSTNSQPEKFTLTVTAGDGGTVSNVNGSYTKGTEVTVTATPNEEFLFSTWSNSATENPLTIVVNSNMTLTASFEKRKYPLTVTISGEGTVQEEIINAGKTTTEYTSGSTIRLTAEPGEGWYFDSWSGALQSTENPIEITVDEAKELTATFTVEQFSIAFDTSSGGMLDTSGGIYDAGTEITVTAQPEADFIFSHWSDDSEENPRTFEVDSDQQYTAFFKNKFDVEDGFYILTGYIDDFGNPVFYEAAPFVFEFVDKVAITCGTVYTDVASFPIFKDLGYVPGAGEPDTELFNIYISRNVIHREYYSGGLRNSWLLRKIDESEIPNRKTHEEVMALVAGKGFWSDPIYAEIDPLVPETYVLAFLKDAERHGIDLSFVDVDKILVEFRDEGFAGLSHLYCLDDDRVHISYYQPFWNSTSYFDIQNERLTVMYHELGHDILNSNHPPIGDMKQLMNQALGDVGPIVWDDSDPMFSFRRMVDDMFSGVGLNYECLNGATDYSSGASGKNATSNPGKSSSDCFLMPTQSPPHLK